MQGRTYRPNLSVRHREIRTVTEIAPAPMMMQHTDSVSAAETRRLRESDAALRSLRDSLNNAPVSTQPVTSDATLATMQATIHFAFDESVLTDSAKAILDEKVEVFRANPAMGIVIVGHTDLVGTDAYNMALGNRRASAAAAYIVARGIEASRVVIESKGESQPITEAAGVAGQAPNRRAIFRLLVAPDVPK